MNNKRIFKEQDENLSELSYKELKNILETERRKNSRDKIKQIIINKVFARFVFSVCIGLNLFFLTLGLLSYFKVLG